MKLICLAEKLIRIFLTNTNYTYFLAYSSWPGLKRLADYLQFSSSAPRRWVLLTLCGPCVWAYAYTVYTLYLHI